MMDLLFIKAHWTSNKSFLVNLETLEALFVFNLVKSDNIQLLISAEKEIAPEEESLVKVDLTNFKYNEISKVPNLAKFCQWPVIVKGKQVLSGLCSVLRQLVKYSTDKTVTNLLGFREACLLACAESSVWTNFCEVDIINTTKKVLNDFYTDNKTLALPQALVQYEHHLNQPVRTHNVYKLAREKSGNKKIVSSAKMDNLGLSHTFSEGTEPTLADIILYPCFEIFFNKYLSTRLAEELPLTVAWYHRMAEIYQDTLGFKFPENKVGNILNITVPTFKMESLYKGDATQSRSTKRAFTKQHVINRALETLLIPIENDHQSFGHDVNFNWLKIPSEADPVGGALPKSRAGRKREQLESIARAVAEVVELTGKLCRIVDFCSGSGHLGILLAVFLPQNEIILVENKERSLERAKARIEKLGLENVTIVQSNLDYFKASFDVGVSLHACGSATDLVIASCIRQGAHFIACPCCYGSIKNCLQITYPRSSKFRDLGLSYEMYLSLAHGADQTHDCDNVKTSQGYRCMDVVDTDRRLHGLEMGYDVRLGKLWPMTCTNKNNLLVGIKM